MRGLWLGLVLLSSASALAAEPSVRVVHDPPDCLPTDRYAVIAAQGEPADRVASAELQFRTDPAGGWYRIPMAREGVLWRALLPRADREVPGFQYRVVLLDAGLMEFASEPFGVPVVSRPGCRADTRSAVEKALLVHVPPGAPVVPPVPPGFSPVGVRASDEGVGGSRGLKTVLAGAVVVAGAGAFVATRGEADLSRPDANPELRRTYRYGGTRPTAEAPLSLSRSTLEVFVGIDYGYTEPFDLDFRFDIMASGFSTPCVTMRGQTRATGWYFPVSAPLVATGACPERFTSSGVRLVLRERGLVRYDFTHVPSPPFVIEP